jgi:hypothetical protein
MTLAAGASGEHTHVVHVSPAIPESGPSSSGTRHGRSRRRGLAAVAAKTAASALLARDLVGPRRRKGAPAGSIVDQARSLQAG